MVTVNEKKILCVGGAVSVDRTLRKEDIDYWSNENFSYQEDKLNKVRGDIVITHSAPSFCFPQSKSEISEWLKNDLKLDKDITEERTLHDKLYEKLILNGKHPSKWIYGHFHHSCRERVEETEFILLNELELLEINSF